MIPPQHLKLLQINIFNNTPVASMSSTELVSEASSMGDAGKIADHSELCTHHEARFLYSHSYVEGAISCHTLHVQSRQQKCLRTK